jgi:hypothetical protein
MKNEFVTHNQALKLNELGFNEPCLAYFKNGEFEYCWDEFVKNSEIQNVNNELDEYVSAPLKQQVLRWFREKYSLVGLIEIGPHHYSFFIYDVNSDIRKFTSSTDGDYKGVESDCIDKLIELIK